MGDWEGTNMQMMYPGGSATNSIQLLDTPSARLSWDTYAKIRYSRQNGFVKSGSLRPIDPTLRESLHTSSCPCSWPTLSLSTDRNSTTSTATATLLPPRRDSFLGTFGRLCLYTQGILILDHHLDPTCWCDVVAQEDSLGENQ
jgi:hypothetical protein